MIERQNPDDGTWEPAEPLPWLEEHPWPVRVAFWLRGVSHCGKVGRRERRARQ